MGVCYSFHVRIPPSDVWQTYFKKIHRKPDVPANECLKGKNNYLNSIPSTVDITESSEKSNIQILTFKKLDFFSLNQANNMQEAALFICLKAE